MINISLSIIQKLSRKKLMQNDVIFMCNAKLAH